MRRLVWLQLLFGWLPIWALFATLIFTSHPDVEPPAAALISLRMIVAAALLGLVVERLMQRVPWPREFQFRFIAIHIAGAAAYSMAWVLLNSAIESAIRGRAVLVVGVGVPSFLAVGVWLYITVAGVVYATQATERAARAEAHAARAQLAALRGQLNPHFLFNALHTVVQLIPRSPQQASQSAEQLAGLLRTTIEEDRDLIPVHEELAFIQRYLELERVRFGNRLRVSFDIADTAREALIPSFALQTLVENAVRHGVEPKIDPTDLFITGSVDGGTLHVAVRDTGSGATAQGVQGSVGTGLRRLRERLAALHGSQARLDVAAEAAGGFSASLAIPQSGDE